MNTQSRQTLENRAARLGLHLSSASRQTQMAALSNYQTKPRWELSDGKHQSTVNGYSTLGEVADALEEREIMAEAS